MALPQTEARCRRTNALLPNFADPIARAILADSLADVIQTSTHALAAAGQDDHQTIDVRMDAMRLAVLTAIALHNNLPTS